MASQLKRNRRTKVQVKAVREAAREELAAHHPMTLRQVHYRLVSRDDIVHPNTISAYGTLSAWLRDDRLEGDIPWSWMEDRMRVARGWSGWDDPGEFLGEVLSGYYRDPWQDETQNHYVEVWLEKDALSGIVSDALGRRGKLTAVEASLGTSLSVEEANRMLFELAARGHLEVTVEHGKLLYSFWGHDAP